ncbi:FAD binding domain-containing protein [Pseudonocardia benzenivorans]
MTAALHRPRDLGAVLDLLAGTDDPMVFGGGTAVQILLKQGVLAATDLVDIAAVPGLADLVATPGGLRAGTMVTLRRMETDPLVHDRAPLLAQVYGRVANPRVRNTASVGGNIAHGDYRLDPPTALLVLDARVELSSAAGCATSRSGSSSPGSRRPRWAAVSWSPRWTSRRSRGAARRSASCRASRPTTGRSPRRPCS